MSTENQKLELVTKASKDAVLSAEKAFVITLGEEKAKAVFAKEAGFAIMAMQQNPQLQSCTPQSLQMAVKCVALTGISLNPTTKLAYLIPRKKNRDSPLEANLDISYMGMIEILRNSGSVKHIRVSVVYSCDEFDYHLGTGAFVKHKPALTVPDGSAKVAAYAVAVLPDGSEEPFVMRWSDIMKRKNASKMSGGPWTQWEDEMAVKTVIRTFYKFLPKTPAATEAMRLYDEIQNAASESLAPKEEVF